MQGTNRISTSVGSAFRGASDVDLQKITNLLLQLHQEVQRSSDADGLVQSSVELLFESCDPVMLLLAFPESLETERFKLHGKTREGYPDISPLVSNLLLTGIDSVSADLLDSISGMSDLSTIFLKSPNDAAVRLLLFIASDDPKLSAWLRSVIGSIEFLLRIRIEHFYTQRANDQQRAYLTALRETAGDANPESAIGNDLLSKTAEQAAQILNADGCAILYPVDEGWSGYRVHFALGFPGDNIPLPPALFTQGFMEFEAHSSSALVYEGEEDEKFLLVPLSQRKDVQGIFFLYIKRPGFQLTQQARQIAELFGFRLSLAAATAAIFQQAFESQTEWENTFDSISDPIYIVDKEFRLKKMNRSLAQLVNRADEDLTLNRNCYRYLFQRDVICPWCPVLKLTQTEDPVTVEAKLFSSSLWQIQSFPYRDKSGERVGAIQVLRDITLLTRMQEQLIETEKLASMGKLISGVAHEVRNPLFGISATARALSNELGSNEKLQPYLEIITSETSRLNRLMEDLLDYSRPVRIDKNPSDVTEMIQEVIDHFRQLSSGDNLIINFLCADRIPPINVDRNRLKQVLFNLVENGIQHAGEKPQIDIFLEYLSLMDPPQIRIVIKDNGSGVPPENLPRIFDPFFTTRQRGTGLGLSIVRKVIHDHDGRIAVESHPGVGTTFRISLPVLTQPV